MNTPVKKRKFFHSKEIVIGLVLILVSLAALYVIKPPVSGYTIISEQKYTWAFSNPSEYSFDSKLLNLSENVLSLKLQENVTTITQITYTDTALSGATYNSENVLSNLNAIDNNQQEVKSDKNFDITLENALNNGDKIGFYMAESKESGTIYVCAQNTNCDSPGYGSVSYDGSSGWFNITLSNLGSSSNSFRIRTTEKFKFDYIKATYKQTTTQSQTSYYYPSAATIETPDLPVGNLSKWKVFGANSISYGQTISYQYSTDSGTMWNDLNAGDDLSDADNLSGKIKFRATLGSTDRNTTPLLYWMSISYDTQFTPLCTENWACTAWSVCTENNTQARVCSDVNACGTVANKPAEQQSCVYILPEIKFSANETSKIISIEANRTFTINASAAQGMDLELSTKDTIYNTSLSIAKYDNVSVSTANVTEKPAKFQEINATADLSSTLSWAIIKIYYTDDELTQKKLNETTLKIYFYNENSGNWDTINSFVNTTGKYVWANVTHFSLYGVFGDQTAQVSTPPASGGGSGGGGGGGGGGGETVSAVPQPAAKLPELKPELKKPTTPTPKAAPIAAPVQKPPEETKVTEKTATAEKPKAETEKTPSALAIFLKPANIGVLAAGIFVIAIAFLIWKKQQSQKLESNPN